MYILAKLQRLEKQFSFFDEAFRSFVRYGLKPFSSFVSGYFVWPKRALWPNWLDFSVILKKLPHDWKNSLALRTLHSNHSTSHFKVSCQCFCRKTSQTFALTSSGPTCRRVPTTRTSRSRAPRFACSDRSSSTRSCLLTGLATTVTECPACSQSANRSKSSLCPTFWAVRWACCRCRTSISILSLISWTLRAIRSSNWTWNESQIRCFKSCPTRVSHFPITVVGTVTI